MWHTAAPDCYDIVPVAVYDDLSLGVCGYAGAGYCRVRLDGELMWKSGLENADLVPTIHSLGQRAAVGSVNDNGSLIVSCAGDVLGDHDEAAVFAAYPDGGWIALSRHSVARLSATGTALWRHPIDAQLSWGAVAPLVDRHGAIFVVDGDSLMSFAPSGARALTLKLGAISGPLAPVGPGTMAVVVDDELCWIASS